MEKRFTFALVLSIAVLVLWNQFILGPQNEERRKKALAEQEAQALKEAAENPPGATGEAEQRSPEAGEDQPAKPEIDPARIQTWEFGNDALRVRSSNVGATIEQASLLKFRPNAQAPEGTPLRMLVKSPDGLNALRLDDADDPSLDLGTSVWDVESSGPRHVTYKQRFSYTTEAVEVRDGKRTVIKQAVAYLVSKTFRVPEGDATYLDVELTVTLVEGTGTSFNRKFNLLVTGGVFQELGTDIISGPRSAVYPVEDSVELALLQQVESESSENGWDVNEVFRTGKPAGVKHGLGGSPRFVADLGTYLGAFLLLEDGFPSPTSLINAAPLEDDRGRRDGGGSGGRTCTALNFEATCEMGEPTNLKALFYLGPIEDDAIEAMLSDRLSETQVSALSTVYDDQLGWASAIGRFILWVLRSMYALVGNWGWAIVLLTLCVRIVLFPVNRKSQAAMIIYNEKMAKLKPKLEALKKKHEGDQRKFAEEQMKLMREHGVGLPLGGCLPIFLQIPIFFGLFSALRATVELRQASWWWVDDLSQPDHLITFDTPVFNPMAICGGCCGMPAPPITGLHLLPILMTIAWVINSMLMPRPETSNPQMEQQRKMMMFMPLIFGVFMYSYAAGLSLYWLTSSVVGIIESRVIKKIWPIKST